MIMTKEQELLKAQSQFQALLAEVELAIEDGRRLDQIEENLFAGLLGLGLTLLSAFVAGHGDGDVGETVTDVQDHCWKRLPQPHTRRYVSVFGELTIDRFVYGTREGQKIQAVPLDARIGLPASDFSYLLENWVQRLCVKESFDEAAPSLQSLLGLRLGVRTLEAMNQRVAAHAERFQQQLPAPLAEEEEAILVVAADGKGVPMRRPLEERVAGRHRRTKGEKANKKQMAYVGAVYTIAPFVRTAEEVVDEVLRQQRAQDRPRPKHKRVYAKMTQTLEGGEVSGGRETLFEHLSDELVHRNRRQYKPVVCLLDGERALWDKRQEFFPWSVGILDLFHVLERVWLAAHAWHAEGSTSAETFVTDRLRWLLAGKVGQVIGGLKRRLQTHPLSAEKRRKVETVIGYLENNRASMKYDEYLGKGYPIGSGVVEGACRHLVKDRLEQTGMRWTVAGAQAMLDMRATYLNGEWSVFMDYRIEEEQNALYADMAV